MATCTASPEQIAPWHYAGEHVLPNTPHVVEADANSMTRRRTTSQVSSSNPPRPDPGNDHAQQPISEDYQIPQDRKGTGTYGIDSSSLTELSGSRVSCHEGALPIAEARSQCLATCDVPASKGTQNSRLSPVTALSTTSTASVPQASHSASPTGLVTSYAPSISVEGDAHRELPDLRVSSHQSYPPPYYANVNGPQHPLSAPLPEGHQRRPFTEDVAYQPFSAYAPSYAIQQHPAAFHSSDPRGRPFLHPGPHPLSVQQPFNTAPLLYTHSAGSNHPITAAGQSLDFQSHHPSDLYHNQSTIPYIMQHPAMQHSGQASNMVGLYPLPDQSFAQPCMRPMRPPASGYGPKLTINTSCTEQPMCVVCSGTNAPWRRGPLGLRTLCNSCGHIKNSGREATNFDEAIQMLEDLRIARISRVRRRHDSQDISEMLRNLQALPESTLILARARFPMKEVSAASLYAPSSGFPSSALDRLNISSAHSARTPSSGSVRSSASSRMPPSVNNMGYIRPRVLADVVAPYPRSAVERQALRQRTQDVQSPAMEADAIAGLLQASRAASEKSISPPTSALSETKRVKLPSIASLSHLPPPHAYHPMASTYPHGHSAPPSPSHQVPPQYCHVAAAGADGGMMRSRSYPGLHVRAPTLDMAHSMHKSEHGAAYHPRLGRLSTSFPPAELEEFHAPDTSSTISRSASSLHETSPRT